MPDESRNNPTGDEAKKMQPEKPRESLAKEKNSVQSAKEIGIDDAEMTTAFTKMPEPMRQVFLAMTRTISRNTPSHSLFEKFTPEHTSQFLDNIRRDDENEYKLKSSNRWFHVIYVFFAMAFLLFLIVFLLPKDKDLLNKIIELLIAFGGGFGAGYGVKSWRNKAQ